MWNNGPGLSLLVLLEFPG